MYYVPDMISVIIPVYNAENYIRAAIESVLSQNYSKLEIVIVDDCSTDGTAGIIRQIESETSCIKYKRLEQNSGVAIARNEAMKIANGRFIAFIDSDDIWLQGKLNEQMKIFEEHKGCPFSYTAIKYIDEKGLVIKEKRAVNEKATFESLQKNTFIATSTVIIDRDVVGAIDMPNRRSAEDYSLWLTLLKKYGPSYGLNEAYTLYRKSSNSVSANKLQEIRHFYSVQTKDLGINCVIAMGNTLCYVINAIRKHFL